MPIRNRGEVVDFDVEAACEAVERTVEGSLRSCVEYDADRFNPVYVDDVTRAFYDDEDEMYDHFDQIHSYVHLDLAEMDLFTEELFPIADRVRYLVTALDAFKLVRVYVDGDGLFLALDHDEPVEPIVEAIHGAIDEEE